MSTTLEAKLRTGALAFSGLNSLIAGRWYDSQLLQGSAMPAVVVLTVSNPRNYVVGGRLPTSWQRVQFTIWGSSGEQARAVVEQLASFLDQFSAAAGITKPAYDNLIVNDRGGMYVETQPPLYQRIVDAMIFANDTL